MNTFAARIAATAVAALALVAPVSANAASAVEIETAGAPGLVHVVNTDGQARCAATLVATNAVVATAACVTNEDGRPAAAAELKVVEGDQTLPVTIVWVNADADADLAVLTLGEKASDAFVAHTSPAVQATYPGLAVATDWVTTIVTASATPDTETVPAEPIEVVPAAVNPLRHFFRVER